LDTFPADGASPELVRTIDLGLTVPRKLDSADATLIDKRVHARLQQGDRFIVVNNGGYDTELPYRLFSRAVQLEPLVAGKLEGVIYAFTVLGNFDRRDFQ